MDTNISQATVLAGVVMANIVSILGAYVSLKVAIAKLEVKVDALMEDVDALWEKYRTEQKQK